MKNKHHNWKKLTEADRAEIKERKRLERKKGQWRRDLKALSFWELHRKLSKIKDCGVKIHVACIVWWDALSGHFVREKVRHHFQRYLMAYNWNVEPDVEGIVDGLILMGYPEFRAKARGKTIRSQHAQI